MTVTPLRDPMATAVLLTRLFERAAAERVEVARLTDEEVSLLDGSGSDQVAPFPWLSTLEPAQQETAREVAARGLVARGLAVVTSPEDTGAGDRAEAAVSIAVDDDVYAVLAARRASTAIVIAERRTPELSHTRVLYLEGDQGVVEEDVSPGGLHTFNAGPTAAAFDALTTFVDPAGAAQEDGPVEDLDLGPGSTDLEDVSDSTEPGWVTVVIAVVPVDGEPQEHRMTVISSDRSVRVVRPVEGRPAVTLQQVGAPTLASMLTGLVAEDGVSGSPTT